MKVKDSRLWLISIVLSVIALGVIAYKWSNVHADQMLDKYNDPSIAVVKDSNQLSAYFKKHAIADSIYKVKTGFFIESMYFISSHEINFTGYLWQKYPLDYPETWEKGIVFPEAVHTADTRLDSVYYSNEGQEGAEYQLIGWYFDVDVRQIFDYRKYPLDYVNGWLRVWAKDLNNDDRIMLVPDFESYAENQTIFGMDQDMFKGEYEIKSTFFSYHDITYNTNFGYYKDKKETEDSEFYMNVGLVRNFTDAVILNLIPLFVVALLLFAQVMTITNKKYLMNMFGFNTSVAIGTCSALFFIVLLAHIQVRREFLDSPLVYIEYFYLIMYVIIILTAFNAYVFPLGKQKTYLNLIYYRNNLIPKVAFWPGLLWMAAFVTLLQL